MLPHAHVQILLCGRGHAGHPLEVLRGFLVDYVQNVVYRDDPHQTVLVVHHGDRQEAVLLEGIRYVLLVVQDVYIDDVLVHQLLEPDLVVRYHEGPKGDDTQELSPLILYIAGVDSLAVHALLFDICQRFRDGHIFSQTDIIRRHQASRAGFRIV